jgi:hypothetical protein
MFGKFIRAYQLAYRKKRFRNGTVLTHFIAKDIRRDVEVVDASEIDQGFIIAKVRTWNVLYASKGIAPKPAFGEPTRMSILNLWEWPGAPWGGPVPKP